MKPTGSDPITLSNQPRRFVHGQSTDRAALAAVARNAMVERGLEPDFPPAAREEMASIKSPAVESGIRDVRDRLWCRSTTMIHAISINSQSPRRSPGNGSEFSWR